jgi:hypothetical protein
MRAHATGEQLTGRLQLRAIACVSIPGVPEYVRPRHRHLGSCFGMTMNRQTLLPSMSSAPITA